MIIHFNIINILYHLFILRCKITLINTLEIIILYMNVPILSLIEKTINKYIDF